AWQLLPGYAIRRSGEAQATIFFPIAAGIKHPILAVRLPDRGLAQAIFIKRAIRAELHDRVGAELLPSDAVGAARNPEPLPSGAILAEIIHVERAADANDVRVGDAALLPNPARAGFERRGRALRPR